ncbi:MAG: hypothetical protein HON50_08045, partial [Candidatus Marinimicrobia bacterium]|nr:hypothetical protein [Candidatus Neomarinimicrobiota bacterium]
FESISGVDVQISGAISEFSLANTQLQSGASVSLAPADDSIDATSGIIGSTDADRITGSTSADNIYGGSGNDIILGGGGNDTIVGGAGNDVLDGGAGDDIFIITEGDGFYSADQNSINGISGDNWFNQLLIVDSITGNAGDDKVVLEFTDNIDSKAIYFSENSLSSIETVDFDGSPYYFRMFVDASVWDSVDNWNLYTGNENWPNGSVRLSIIGNDNNLDLSGLESSFNTDRIWLEGEFYDVDLTNLTATINEFKIDKLSSFTGSSNNDTVIIRDDSFDFSGGAGNDRVTINYDWRGSISNELSGTFHGGDGSDTLAFYEAYNRTIDLTNLDFIDFENIDTGSNSVVVTSAQYDSLTFSGSGAVYTDVNGVLQGTDDDDSFTGDGTGQFKPGAGDDTVSRVDTVIYDGNQHEFTIARDSDNPSQLTVEHSGGDSSQGTDAVADVLNLSFSDGSTYVVDDHHGFKTSGSRDVSYDEIITANFEHRNDQDVFTATFVPSSPLKIEANAGDTSFRIYAKDIASGQELQFKNITHSWVDSSLQSGSADDWLPGFNTNSGFEVYQGGEVELRVNSDSWSWSDQTSQSYDFAIKLVDDYTDSESTRGEMDATKGYVRGYIGDLDDVDWIKTELIEGTTYLIDVRGQASEGGTLADPKVEVYKSTNTADPISAISTGNAVGTDEQIRFYVVESGTYYIAISDATGLYKGSYIVEQKSLDQQSADIATTGRIEFNDLGIGTAVGEINEFADRDWFKVQLEKGFAYKIEALGASTSEGTLTDPYVEVRSATGILLSSASTGGSGTNAQVYF